MSAPIFRYQPCDFCKGTGRHPHHIPPVDCPVCRGLKLVSERIDADPKTFRCDDCDGHGWYSHDPLFRSRTEPCPTCNTTGRVPDRRKAERREGERRKG